jgi:hypothetical protein
MTEVQKPSFARAGVVAIALALFSSAISFAQTKADKPKRQYIQATAQGTGTQMGRVISIQITIEEYSTADDQNALMEAYQEKGQEGLFHALDKMKAKGRMAITGTLGYDINYIRTFPMPDGSRKIRIVTDRPVRFAEAWSSSRSSDYNLSAAEIIVSPQKGKSSGTLLPACQFKIDKENGLEIENFQNPWKLSNISGPK